MGKNSSTISIDDIAEVGVELHEDELANITGGYWIILIACSSASGGGYDYD